MRPQFLSPLLACAVFMAPANATESHVTSLSVDAAKYFIRNGFADSAEAIALARRLTIKDVQQCRRDVADDLYSRFSDPVSIVQSAARSALSDPLGAASNLVSPEVFSAAADVLNHMQSNLAPDTLRCAELVARAQSIAACTPHVDSLRRNVVTAFVKVGVISSAITRSLFRRCDILFADDSRQ